MSTEPIREYRDYLTTIHHPLTELAWLYHMNRGVFMTPGVDEEWTLSVLHADADLQRYVEVFETFASRRHGRIAERGAASGRLGGEQPQLGQRRGEPRRCAGRRTARRAMPLPSRRERRDGVTAHEAPLGQQRALARVGRVVGRVDAKPPPRSRIAAVSG